jgi:hypothetical protein
VFPSSPTAGLNTGRIPHLQTWDNAISRFDNAAGSKSLVSLKHKAVGDLLTNLDTDFWKSIRIWLKHYLVNGRILSDANFMLFTTADISATSFLKMFADDKADGELARKRPARCLPRAKLSPWPQFKPNLEL